MNKTKIRFNFSIIVIVVLIMLLLCSISTFFFSPNKVYALTNTGSAVKAGGGFELWDSNNNSFNNYVISDLANKLFGNENPIKYTKSMKDTQTDSYVIPASAINAKVGNTTNGMVVKLGGKEWMVSSLTIADKDGKEDIVLTLYLADADGTSIFNSNANDIKGNNSYSNSVIRNELLTGGKWSLFNQTGENSFAEKYLVQPKYIKYQHIQSRIGREGNPYRFPNEALDDFADYWHSNYTDPYKSSDMFADPNGVLQRYDAWGEDYIWVPSFTEAGANDFLNANSIWKLSDSQRAQSGSGIDGAWYRSAHGAGECNGCYFMRPNGIYGYERVNAVLGIRPAIHLNLTEVLSEVANTLENPEDLESTYNEKVQTLSEILALKDNTHWYNKDLYEKDNEYVTISYPDGKTFQNAGDYWIKLEIKSSWIDKVDAEIEEDIAAHSWTEAQQKVVREFRRAKFRGEADTTDPDHLESDTVRWIKITINKAEIDFSKVKWSADSLEYNALNQSVTITEGLPSFVTIKTYSDNAKKAVGSYTAQVIEITCTDNNYKVPDSTDLAKYPTLKHTWQITKKKVTANWKLESSTQDGITIAKPVINVDNSIKSSIEYTYYKDSNMTEQISLNDIFAEFDITELKTYWVKATIKTSGGDYNSSNCTLANNSGQEITEAVTTMQTGSTSNSVIVELTNKKVTFNNSQQKANFTITGGITEEDIVITYYTLDGTQLSSAPTNAGKYKVRVSLKEDLTDFIITGATEFEFEIESLKVNKPRPSQTQYYDADGFVLSDIVTLPKDWKNYFEIRVYDKDNNEIQAQNDSWKFVNVNVYKIEIKFKEGTNTSNVLWNDSTRDTIIVELDIKPLEFTMQGWSESTGNKKPVITGIDAGEVNKYFDYIIYEIKNGVIVGNMLPSNATLKYNTDYQISLKVKDEFKGNVFINYNGELLAETETINFKTAENPNPDGGDGDNEEENNGGSGGNKGNGSNTGTEAWFGTDGKLPLFGWILVGVVILLLIILILILVLRGNKRQPPQQPIPYAQYYSEKKEESNNTQSVQEQTKEEPVRNVRGTIVNNYKVGYKDWTFVIKETDVLNPEVLENQNERVLMYACKESEIRKLKKFQSALAEDTNEIGETNINNTDSKSNKKGKGKKRNN